MLNNFVAESIEQKQKGAFISILPFSIGVGIAINLFVVIHDSNILSDVGLIAPNLLNTPYFF